MIVQLHQLIVNSTKQEAVVHVNTNTLLLEAGEEEDNDTMSRPQLSVTVDYETPEDTPVEAAEDEAGIEDKYLSLDSYNVHSPQFHPQVGLNVGIHRYHTDIRRYHTYT